MLKRLVGAILVSGLGLAGGANAAGNAAPAQVITSINLQYLKDFFDSVSVFSKIENAATPAQAYISFAVDGHPMLAMVFDCEGSNLDGKCHAFALGSGTFREGMTAEQASAYFGASPLFAAPTFFPNTPGPMLKYQASIYGGVAPDFVNNVTAIFAAEETKFIAYGDSLKPAAASGVPGSATTGFTVEEGRKRPASTAPFVATIFKAEIESNLRLGK